MKSRERDLFLCSIGNTGTWTLVWNITQHPEVGGCKIVEYYRHPEFRPDLRAAGDDKLHRIGVGGKEVQERYCDEGRMLLFRHFHAYKGPPGSGGIAYTSTDQVCDDVLMRMCYGVTTLRDPVESILTVTHREQRVEHTATMATRAGLWPKLVEMYNKEHFKCIPLGNAEHSEAHWREYLKWAGLSPKAGDWGATNSSGRNAAHSAYSNGDLAAMLSLEPRMAEPVRILRDNVDTLRPFLEKYGYENLPWWK